MFAVIVDQMIDPKDSTAGFSVFGPYVTEQVADEVMYTISNAAELGEFEIMRVIVAPILGTDPGLAVPPDPSRVVGLLKLQNA